MIPSVIAGQVRQGIAEYLETTFPVSTPLFARMLERFLDDGHGVFKGPYVSVRLPFRGGGEGWHGFGWLPMGFAPYAHQRRAFERLAAGRSTVVATGTGSGKTESFLYPILEDCLARREEPGIKAIIVYPMNALAHDQSRRLARLIHASEALRGVVRAGMYVGERDGQSAIVMEEERVITNRETMRLAPPDILLTNYKMLDYLLVRAQDHGLWRENGADTLRFLVVDELHTFDGAQGTDLACLVRRLKARLGTPPGGLCCVATSATIGGAAQVEELRGYASTVFGESFDGESIITEETLSADAFLAGSEATRSALPAAADAELDARHATDLDEYARLQARMWFGQEAFAGGGDWTLALPSLLRAHVFFRQMIRALEQGPRALGELREALVRALPEYAALSGARQALLLDSMLALVALARVEVEGRPRPFLWSRLQLWQRELSRLVASVGVRPSLSFSSDLTDEQLRAQLPVVHCRECGVMGWSGLVASHQQQVQGDLTSFYSAYFALSASVAYLMPLGEADRDLPADVVRMRVCGSCLSLEPGEGSGPCAVCREAEALVPVAYAQPRIKSGARYIGSHDCPFCRGVNSLAIVGSRAASLVSVAIGQLFSSRFSPHKKLLAFSDSVQDASHRAGFFGARTYRLTVRSAVQQALAAAGGRVPLGELPERVFGYWRARLDAATFVATFLPPDLEWLEEYEELLQTGSLRADGGLERMLAERMEWEVWAEYGYNCRIGRTLEKTGASIAAVLDARMAAAADGLLEPLRNECGGLRGLDRARLVVFLHGIVTQLKNKGGIDHAALTMYIEDKGRTFRFNKQWALPGLLQGMRMPMFVADRRGTSFDTLTSEARRMTWYEQWAAKCFGDIDTMIDAEVRDVYRLVMQALVASRVLFARTVQGHVVWGIDASALVVEDAVTQMRCDSCGHQISVATRHVAVWEGAPCLRFSCRGRHAAAARRDDYYRNLYTVGEVRRIFAREHTGLLPRAQREELEGQFIAGDRAGAPNLLSCTPTLEMGIDIGDLSSVVLCSVPPSQANYLQRIGRSGRASGAAFTYTIATSRPHDLYFHAQPEEMLAGGVDTPGCFLNAPAVLERQFMAYCFDRWMVATKGAAVVPARLGQVLAAVGGSSPAMDRFPYTLIAFITDNRDALLDGFLGMFGAALGAETCASLRQHVMGSPDGSTHLSYRLLNALLQLVREVEDLRRRVRRLTTVIRELQARVVRDAQHDEELDALEIEKAALVGIIERIRSRDTLNFFTDEGLLPNYAFPEAGVVLRSILYRRTRGEDGAQSYRTRTYEYERPASSAIHEFAFENSFYADGRRVTIDRVNMALSELEEWQFCSECSYHEQASSDGAPACPRCGNALWSDMAYRRRMLRIRQVEAVTSERRSRSHDESDDRTPRFFNRRMMVVYDRTRIARSYALDAGELPFGFEYMTRATFREINFGEKGRSGETLHIAGMDVLTSAFTLCRDCGKVQREGKPPAHAGTCRHARGTGSGGGGSEGARIECVFLYREFDSEAIRILLPSTSFAVSSVTFHTFVGCLYLGLRRRFRGRIDHLRTMVDEEPAAGGEPGRRYLLLYDTVPGGTGYLKELMADPASFMDVFALALDVLRSCGCRTDADRDGCYRCIYSYRYSDEMAEMSRARGVELMQEIVTHRDRITAIDSLSEISCNALLESELEALCIEAFRRAAMPGVRTTIMTEIVRGRSGWVLTVGERSYLVEPQVELGPRDGVAVPCRVDFVLHPTRSESGVLPVAVFTDGYAFHANASVDEHMRVGRDMAQRMALVASGRYRVWSLTWDDVQDVFKRRGRSVPAFAGRHRARLLPLLDAYDAAFGVKALSQAHETGSFSLLLQLLATPDPKMWKMHALLQVLALVSVQTDASAASSLVEAVRELPSGTPLPMPVASDGGMAVGLDMVEDEDGEAFCRMCATIATSALTERKLHEARLLCRLHDEDAMALRPGFAAVWNGFLAWYNLLQFAPQVEFVTTRGCAEGAYAFLAAERERQLRAAEATRSEEVEEQLGLVHASARDLLVQLLDAGVPLPVVGHELCAAGGGVLGGAELAWVEARCAVFLAGADEDRGVYAAAGWTVLGVEDDDVVARVADATRSTDA